jgi:hypothetical protein
MPQLSIRKLRPLTGHLIVILKRGLKGCGRGHLDIVRQPRFQWVINDEGEGDVIITNAFLALLRGNEDNIKGNPS